MDAPVPFCGSGLVSSRIPEYSFHLIPLGYLWEDGYVVAVFQPSDTGIAKKVFIYSYCSAVCPLKTNPPVSSELDQGVHNLQSPEQSALQHPTYKFATWEEKK